MSNKLFIAAAGSGKTTFLIREALRIADGRALVTTFTQANAEEIRGKFIKEHGCIPAHVTVQTWFSFLLQHGARPYQGCKYDNEINGLILMNGQSARGIAETNTDRHYFNSARKIYSEKLPKFVVKCNEQSDGAVISRLSRIYSHIFIDEVQDLSGYDLDFLRLLFASSIDIILVCDPRQGTYSTGHSSRNRKYQKSGILAFFNDAFLGVEIDDTLLTINHRCVPAICDFSNRLYRQHPQTGSDNHAKTGHDGVFLVKPGDVAAYLSAYRPMQLRDSARDTRASAEHMVMNFGQSKGLEFSRVLIYPTKPFTDWLANSDTELAPTSLAKFYVAVTRARVSVGIVYDYEQESTLDWIERFVRAS